MLKSQCRKKNNTGRILLVRYCTGGGTGGASHPWAWPGEAEANWAGSGEGKGRLLAQARRPRATAVNGVSGRAVRF